MKKESKRNIIIPLILISNIIVNSLIGYFIFSFGTRGCTICSSKFSRGYGDWVSIYLFSLGISIAVITLLLLKVKKLKIKLLLLPIAIHVICIAFLWLFL